MDCYGIGCQFSIVNDGVEVHDPCRGGRAPEVMLIVAWNHPIGTPYAIVQIPFGCGLVLDVVRAGISVERCYKTGT